ncbi:protein DDB_G0276689-like [Melanaphis sacchari]|uniref:protein DDB_G0276689-like n=1 Tax=Melanaphis sacchari TaxID=742174 RepID=UPI000DC1523A|nr:protein DDB_G0276689-like [Melanaphis sacchari]
MNTGSQGENAEVIVDEFEVLAKETLDRIIDILENDSILDINLSDSNSELINDEEVNRLIEEDKLELNKINKPVDDILNKSLRLINLDEFENNPTTSTCKIGLRSNKNIIHTEYIPAKRTVKTKKMATSKVPTLKVIDALHMIPQYSGQTEMYPFINACETIIDSVDPDQLPLLLKMITATKLTGRAFNVTRYKEIKEWNDIKKLLLDAFESPYGAANLQIELNIIKFKNDETIQAYNNRVEEIFQKLCDAVAVGKPSSEAIVLRENIKEQAMVSYINGLPNEIKFEVKTKNPNSLDQAMQVALVADKNIRTYNNVQEIFRANHNEYNKQPNKYNNNYNNNRGQNNNQNTSYRNNNSFRGRNNNQVQNSRNNNFNVRRCFTCNREGHFSSQCRMNNQTYTRPPGGNTNQNSRDTCTYCNKTGHTIAVCYKKQNDERRNNSGNGQNSHATHGARAIQTITVDPSEIAFQPYSQQ